MVVEPLDQALGFGVAGLADDHLRAEHATERLATEGRLGAAGSPPPDRAFAVPDQHQRYRAEGPEVLPPAGVEVLGMAGRDQHRRGPPGVPTHHREHRQQLGRGPDLAVPDRELDVGNQKSHWAISPAAYVVREAGPVAGRPGAGR